MKTIKIDLYMKISISLLNNTLSTLPLDLK